MMAMKTLETRLWSGEHEWLYGLLKSPLKPSSPMTAPGVVIARAIPSLAWRRAKARTPQA